MAAMTFDTLKFARTLREKAKLTAEQAEGISEAFSEATSEQIVTKSDLRDELSPIRVEIAAIRGELNLLKWMMGFTLALLVAIFLKLFLRG